MDLQKKSKKTMGYSLENRITEVRQGWVEMSQYRVYRNYKVVNGIL